MIRKALATTLVLLLAFVNVAMADEFADSFYIPPIVNEGQYPVQSDEPITLSYFVPFEAQALPHITSYKDNVAWKKHQEATGISIDFIHPSTDTAEAFQLMLASGDLPDIIEMTNPTWYSGGLLAMYNDGIIQDLTPYMEDDAPQYKEVIGYSDTCTRQVTEGGMNLGFYKITYEKTIRPYVRANLREDWLIEFGLQNPVTIADYEAYFDAILLNKPGVTPLHIGFQSQTEIMPLSSAYDLIKSFFVEDGTVKHFWNDDNLYDFLTLMHAWYEKGYISSDFASLTGTEVAALFDSGNLGMYIASCDTCADRTAALENFSATNARYMRKEADSIVRTETANTPVTETYQVVTVVTTACKNVEAAVQFLNYGYTKEGSMLHTFGEEGVAWVYDPVTGVPNYTDLMVNNPDGWTISHVSWINKIHASSAYVFPDAIGIPFTANNYSTKSARDLWAGEADPNVNAELRLPPIKLSSEETDERAELMTQVDSYGQEMLFKFIVGTESLDRENFDAYVKKIEGYGLTRALEITQTAYDRFMSN